MKTCKTCKHINLSKNHLNQGTCDRIVQVGTIAKYREGKLTLSKDQVAGFIDNHNDHIISLLINIDTFGCQLFEGQTIETSKSEGFKELNKSDPDKEVPSKMSVEPKKTKSIENNK